MRTSLSRVDYVMLQHLHATWHRARREGLDPQLTIEKEERRFDLVRRYDPTGGRYHWWLSVWRRALWDERGFQAHVTGEELARIREALAIFDARRHLLTPEFRDIGQYRTERDLRSFVPTRIAQARRKEEKEALRSAARSQSQPLFHEGAWRIVKLGGYDAARFWGLGTKWCTTSSPSEYDAYARSSPLVVLLTPHGKFQLHLGGELKDAINGAVDPLAFRGAPPGFRKMLVDWGALT